MENHRLIKIQYERIGSIKTVYRKLKNDMNLIIPINLRIHQNHQLVAKEADLLLFYRIQRRRTRKIRNRKKRFEKIVVRHCHT